MLDRQEKLHERQSELKTLLEACKGSGSPVKDGASVAVENWSGPFDWDAQADDVRFNIFGISTYRANQREVSAFAISLSAVTVIWFKPLKCRTLLCELYVHFLDLDFKEIVYLKWDFLSVKWGCWQYYKGLWNEKVDAFPLPSDLCFGASTLHIELYLWFLLILLELRNNLRFPTKNVTLRTAL